MFIKHLSVTNFKSFEQLDISLDKLNIVVGANASGKSNLIAIFEFLRNIAKHGLDNAISMEGGVEYLRNTRIGTANDLCLGITYEPEAGYVIRGEKPLLIGVKVREATYEFALRFQRGPKGFKVSKDKLDLKYDFVRLERKGRGKKRQEIQEKESLGSGETTLAIQNGRIGLNINLPDGLRRYKDEIVPSFFLREERFPGDMLLLESSLYEFVHRFENPLGQITIYDFDPRLPKRAVSITGKTELEENASNLSIVLMNIVQNKEAKRKFLNFISDLLPFVDDLRVQRFADKSLLFTLREKYVDKSPYLPASFLSDGTVNIAALVIALYFEHKPLLIVEEPERNIHPRLISRVVNMLEEVAKNKQIIVTTHNPEIVKHTSVENLLLISRNEHGFSTVSKPSENEEVKLFLKHELGMDDLYVQDLLGVKSGQ